MKKTRFVRAAVLTMAVGLAASSLVGCGGKPAPMPASGSDPSSVEGSAQNNEKPAHLKLFLTNKNIVDGSYAKKKIEEATNTELEIIQVPTKDLDNKLNIHSSISFSFHKVRM